MSVIVGIGFMFTHIARFPRPSIAPHGKVLSDLYVYAERWRVVLIAKANESTWGCSCPPSGNRNRWRRCRSWLAVGIPLARRTRTTVHTRLSNYISGDSRRFCSRRACSLCSCRQRFVWYFRRDKRRFPVHSYHFHSDTLWRIHHGRCKRWRIDCPHTDKENNRRDLRAGIGLGHRNSLRLGTHRCSWCRNP
jgi:hypothetical protein